MAVIRLTLKLTRCWWLWEMSRVSATVLTTTYQTSHCNIPRQWWYGIDVYSLYIMRMSSI